MNYGTAILWGLASWVGLIWLAWEGLRWAG